MDACAGSTVATEGIPTHTKPPSPLPRSGGSETMRCIEIVGSEKGDSGHHTRRLMEYQITGGGP